MSYKIAFTRQAAKTLRRMPVDMARSIRVKIDQIAEDPFADHPNAARLQIREGYRLRIGDWRITYEIQKEKVIILVVKIGLRGEVYR